MAFDLNVALGFSDVESDDNFVKSLDNEEGANHIQHSEEGGIAYEEEFCSTDEVKNDNINSEECDILSTDSPINDIHEDDFDENAEVAGENIKDESSFRDIEKKFSVGSILSPNLGIIYKLYCEYAHCKGFSVRKGEQRYFGKTTDIRWKEYVCSSSGLPDCRSLKRRVGVYKKMVTRTNCEARLRVVREDLGPFVVSLFETSHNHELVSLDQCYLLRSNRTLNHGHQSVLESMQSAGIGVSVACKFMEKESGGISNVGFTRKDAYHHMDRLKRATKVENGDAQELHKYFTDKANSEPYFFWKYELDDDGKLMNFFFRDSRSALDFAIFGDVLSVDTTYRTNRYNLICAPFVGINHHSSNVLFGMAFMSDETTSSFKWLFESFIESMDGKEPKVIFTDQCQAMMNAIDSTFSSAKHRLCQWHINQLEDIRTFTQHLDDKLEIIMGWIIEQYSCGKSGPACTKEVATMVEEDYGQDHHPQINTVCKERVVDEKSQTISSKCKSMDEKKQSSCMLITKMQYDQPLEVRNNKPQFNTSIVHCTSSSSKQMVLSSNTIGTTSFVSLQMPFKIMDNRIFDNFRSLKPRKQIELKLLDDSWGDAEQFDPMKLYSYKLVDEFKYWYDSIESTKSKIRLRIPCIELVDREFFTGIWTKDKWLGDEWTCC